MARQYNTIHLIAGIAGSSCLLSEMYANIVHTHEVAGRYLDPAVVATIVVSAAGAMALAAAIAAFRQLDLGSIINGFFLLAGFIFAASFSLSTTFERTSSQRDAMIEARLSKSQEYKDLKSEIAGLKRQQSTEEACLSGDGPRCGFLTKRVAELNYQLETIIVKTDSSGVRIATMLDLDPSLVGRVQPMLLPLALFLFANFLVAFAADGRTVPTEFSTELGGRAALEARAQRYAETFKSQHGRYPRPVEYVQTLGLTPAVASRLARNNS